MRLIIGFFSIFLVTMVSSCGGGGSDSKTGKVRFYNQTTYAGQGFSATVSISNVTLTSYSGAHSSYATADCGTFNATVTSGTVNIGTWSGVVIECGEDNLIKLIASGNSWGLTFQVE